MEHQSIPFGTQTLSFTLPRKVRIVRLEPQPPVSDDSPMELIGRALQQPIGSRALSQIAAGRRSAAILIPGKARRAGTRDYVPALVSELNQAGIPDTEIEIVLADGTHEQHLKSDIEMLLGENILSRIRCVGHDPRNEEELVDLGTTCFGTPVLLSRRVLDAEVKILTGRIVPHYFAGFSGGRKALIPGVAGMRTILANHRLTLDSKHGIHPEVGPCSLTANPVHLDMMEGAKMARPDFCFNTLMNQDEQIVEVVAGDFIAAHQKGCQLAAEMFRMTIQEPLDMVITSAGGFPYDLNFVQSLKALFNIQDIVRSGGVILWIAECSSGIHPGFLEWAAIESDLELEEAVRQRYALSGHNSLMLRNLLRKVDVALLSSLPQEIVTRLGLHPVSSLKEGLQWILQRRAESFTCGLIPHANLMCAQILTSPPPSGEDG